MNRKLTRILSLALCAMLLWCALPALRTSAQITENAKGEIVFTTLDDLRQLCADTYPDAVTFVYEGQEALVISGDLTIPQIVTVTAQTVTVAADSVLTVGGQLVADTLTVDGRMTNYGIVSILADLYINGAVSNGGVLYMYAGVDGKLTNTQNLTHLYDESGVIWICGFADAQDLEKISQAAQQTTDSHAAYGVYATEEQVELTGWVSLPANCVLVVTKPLSITGGEGCGLVLEGNGQIEAAMTLQCNLQVGVEGYLEISAPVKVEGSLENKAVIDLFYDDGGRLGVSGPEGYIGHFQEYSSLIFVNSADAQLPQDAVTGLDVNHFQISEMDDEAFGHYWMLYNYQIPASGEILWGDTNGDGVVESFDATLIVQYDVGMIDASGLVMQNMDVSGDGEVNSFDATLILQYDVGMITAFPAEG